MYWKETEGGLGLYLNDQVVGWVLKTTDDYYVALYKDTPIEYSKSETWCKLTLASVLEEKLKEE